MTTPARNAVKTGNVPVDIAESFLTPLFNAKEGCDHSAALLWDGPPAYPDTFMSILVDARANMVKAKDGLVKIAQALGYSPRLEAWHTSLSRMQKQFDSSVHLGEELVSEDPCPLFADCDLASGIISELSPMKEVLEEMHLEAQSYFALSGMTLPVTEASPQAVAATPKNPETRPFEGRKCEELRIKVTGDGLRVFLREEPKPGPGVLVNWKELGDGVGKPFPKLCGNLTHCRSTLIEGVSPPTITRRNQRFKDATGVSDNLFRVNAKTITSGAIFFVE